MEHRPGSDANSGTRTPLPWTHRAAQPEARRGQENLALFTTRSALGEADAERAPDLVPNRQRHPGQRDRQRARLVTPAVIALFASDSSRRRFLLRGGRLRFVDVSALTPPSGEPKG